MQWPVMLHSCCATMGGSCAAITSTLPNVLSTTKSTFRKCFTVDCAPNLHNMQVCGLSPYQEWGRGGIGWNRAQVPSLLSFPTDKEMSTGMRWSNGLAGHNPIISIIPSPHAFCRESPLLFCLPPGDTTLFSHSRRILLSSLFLDFLITLYTHSMVKSSLSGAGQDSFQHPPAHPAQQLPTHLHRSLPPPSMRLQFTLHFIPLPPPGGYQSLCHQGGSQVSHHTYLTCSITLFSDSLSPLTHLAPQLSNTPLPLLHHSQLSSPSFTTFFSNYLLAFQSTFSGSPHTSVSWATRWLTERQRRHTLTPSSYTSLLTRLIF